MVLAGKPTLEFVSKQGPRQFRVPTVGTDLLKKYRRQQEYPGGFTCQLSTMPIRIFWSGNIFLSLDTPDPNFKFRVRLGTLLFSPEVRQLKSEYQEAQTSPALRKNAYDKVWKDARR